MGSLAPSFTSASSPRRS